MQYFEADIRHLGNQGTLAGANKLSRLIWEL